jgi:N-methylhydantoinase A
VEIVNLRLKLELAVDKPLAAPQSASDANAAAAIIEVVPVVFPGGPRPTTAYDRQELRTGNRFSGPAILVQLDSTIVVPPGWAGEVDPYGNLVLEPE